MVWRSLRSAPAQKASSRLLARIRARVGPVAEEEEEDAEVLMASISEASSDRSWRERALRVRGLLRLRTRMWPRWGAGMLWVSRRGGRVEDGRVNGRGGGGRRGGRRRRREERVGRKRVRWWGGRMFGGGRGGDVFPWDK